LRIGGKVTLALDSIFHSIERQGETNRMPRAEQALHVVFTKERRNPGKQSGEGK